MSKLSEIKTLSGYLTEFGTTLSRKAISSLHPLHVPGRDHVPPFDYVPEHRTPFDAQAHLISGAYKAMDSNGACFVIGEPGCGKTLCGALSIHEHAARSRRKGGKGGKYRAIVICPDHLISKWKNEIEDTIPGAVVHCWRPEGDFGTGITLDKWPDFLNLTGLSVTRTKTSNGDQPRAEIEVASVSTSSEDVSDITGHEGDRFYYVDDRPVTPKPTAGKVIQHKKRWLKPGGPEWIVVGRDQIKRQPDWSGVGQPRRCFDGKTRKEQPCKVVVTDHKPLKDANGDSIVNEHGFTINKAIIEKRITCPRCGTVPAKKGVPLSVDSLSKSTQHCCKAMILDEVGDEGGKCKGRDRLIGGAIPYEQRNATPGSIIKHAGKNWRVRICGEPLYQWVRKPNWWPAAKIIQSKLNKIATYLIVDECHEQKSDSSAQSMAMGKILGSTRYCLALTGTFIGGYASHLFPLLMRMAAKDMHARQFEWDKPMDFVERYGCIDRIVRSEAPVESTVSKGSRSMKKAKIGQVKVERKCRPGIMPTLFSEMVMPLAMFLKLEQFIDGLPGFEVRMIACDLPPEIQQAYNNAAHSLAEANRELITNGNMKLMGTMLWTLLSYPDHPWGWQPMFTGDKPEDTTHSVGWWDQPKVWTRENFVGVCSPKNFDADEIILPKERELINLCKTNTEAGDQTWVYCEMTQKRDVMPRLQRLMEAEGLRVGILKSGDVNPREREVWIQKNGYLYDVMLSHPQLVATGLDLFSVSHGNHNFNHLIFYQCGYNLFRLRQAERRSWRIGQPKDCTVTYLYYSGTSQAAALALMGRKAQAAQQLEEGSVSDEGLAAMGGDAGAQAALVKALGEHIDPSEIQRNWSRVKSGGGSNKQPKPTRQSAPGDKPSGDTGIRQLGRSGVPVVLGGEEESSKEGIRRAAKGLSVPSSLYDAERIPPPGVPSPLDHLPIPIQIVSESMIKADDRSVDDALADFRSWLSTAVPEPQEPAVRVYNPDVSPVPGDKAQWTDHNGNVITGTYKGLTVNKQAKVVCDDGPTAGKEVWIPDGMSTLVFFKPEPEPEKPRRLEEFGREELAAMFDKMREGTLKDDDWDW